MNNPTQAEACALEILVAKRWQPPFGVDVMHYYSAISMVPADEAAAMGTHR